MRRLRNAFLVPLSVAAASFAAVAACGGAASEGAPGPIGGDGSATSLDGGMPVTNLPCAVDAILAKNCRTCHENPPKFGAPMPLVTRDDLLALAKDGRRRVEVALARIADDADPMPPPPNERLSQADRDTLAAWVAAGAPASTETCTTTTKPAVSGVDCAPDLPIKPATPHEMPAQAGDQYVCYGVDVTRPTPTHVVGFAPRIDNAEIVHHIVLFESSSAFPSTPQECGSGTSLSWRMVMAWAPGGKGLSMPPEAGFPIQTSGATHYVVQMHYSNPQGRAGLKDTSGFDLCTSAPRPNEADVLAFGTDKIEIPPQTPSWPRTCSVKVPSQLAGLHLVASMPHMHKLGTAMVTKLTPAGGGAEVDLGSSPAFSFDSQAWLPIDAVTATNDVIRTTCTWKNTTGAVVKYGEKTEEEMCYSFTVYWPKVKSPLWSWATPAYTSSCE